MIDIKILLAAFNAKYIHSSLAVRSLYAYSGALKEHVTAAEFSINQNKDFILKEIYRQKPDVAAFSCYIWNVDMVRSLAADLKKVLPGVRIILGGPEITPDAVWTGADIYVYGEGEKTFYELLSYFVHKEPCLNDIQGIGFHENGRLQVNESRKTIALDEVPFVYDETALEALENKILYYESSRGCPFNCQYCLSSAEKGVRFLSMERIQRDLFFFLNAKVQQVKFVDRTFNCKKSHAMAIWTYLMERDNGITNFHFEISADLLDKDCLSLLKKARKGLFQLEIGVQSTNMGTLEVIQRKTSLQKLFQNVAAIGESRNIHQHLDLIAGLPGEDYQSFRQSFNDVFQLQPEMLQLGFLKLLKGSGLRRDAEKLGVVYRDQAPYEVLYTKELSFDGLLRLKAVEDMVERYYNSGGFRYSLRWLIPFFQTPFDFFDGLAGYWEAQGNSAIQHNKMKLYYTLYAFCQLKAAKALPVLKQLLKFDLYAQENLKNLPDWLERTDHTSLKNKISAFYENPDHRKRYYPELADYTPRQISRMCAIEYFGFDILKWITDNVIIEQDTFILFHYYSDDKMVGNCRCYTIDI